MKTYSINSMFVTIQGEGHNAGRRAVFIRFNSCNVWSGREEDRQRDSVKSQCALVCDTMFFGIDENNGGGRFTAVEAVERARELWDKDCEGDTSDFTSVPMFIVFTGGEPSTQLDDELAAAFDAPDKYGRYTILAAETNGSKALPGRLNWVCLSPKPPIAPVNHIYNEVKVLYPLFDPLSYAHLSNVLWVQPVDMFYVTAEIDFWLWREHRAVNRLESLGVCIDFVLRNPRWRISLQTHKIIGVQ